MAGSLSMRFSHAITVVMLVLASMFCAFTLCTQSAFAADDTIQSENQKLAPAVDADPQQAIDAARAEQAAAASVAKTAGQMDEVAALGKLEDGSYADGLVNGASYAIKLDTTDNKVIESQTTVTKASKGKSSKKKVTKKTTKVTTASSDMAKDQRWKVARDSKGYVSFINGDNGKALTVSGKAKSGAAVTLAKYSKTKRSQKWAVIADGDAWKIMSALGKKLTLVVAKGSTKAGAAVRVEASPKAKSCRFDIVRTNYENVAPQEKLNSVASGSWYELCTGKNALAQSKSGSNAELQKNSGSLSQLFSLNFVKKNGSLGYYRIICAATGKALDVADGNFVKGANVQLSKKSSAKSQLWVATAASDGSITLTNAVSGFKIGTVKVKAGANANMRARGIAFKLVQRTNLLGDGFYALKASKKTTKALDIAKSSKKAGAAIQLWTYASNFNQKWRIAAVEGKTNTYTIESVNSGLLMSADSASNGAGVSQGYASGSELQQWVPAILSNGTVVFSSVANSSLTLGYKGGKTKNGTKAVLGTGSGSSQSFRVAEVDAFDPGAYFFNLVANPKLVLEVKKSSVKNRANIDMNKKNTSGHQGNQKWLFRMNANGTFTITNTLSCKALDVAKGKAKAGANVQQWEKNNKKKNQQWYVEYVPGTGSFRIVSALDSKYVLEAASSKNGANVRLGKFSNNALERFTFQKTKPYTGLQQRMFDRAQGMSSKTKYLILVWYDSCQVGIFEGSKGNWDYVKFVQCGPGADNTPTMRGRFEVGHRKPCLPDTPVAKYATQIFLDMYFHSVLFSASEVGHHVSHGCVRMVWDDAKWIYDRIPSGTRVIIE